MRKLAACVVVLACAAPPAAGHETDQFSVPTGRTYANLAPELNARCYEQLVRTVDILNRRLPQGPRAADENELRRLVTPDVAADVFLWQLTPVAVYIETTDRWLATPQLAARYPGLLVAHRPYPRIYDNPLLVIDPTRLVRLVPCSTIEVDGVWLGTDKLAHFFHAGYLYFKDYQRARARGLSEQQANAEVLRTTRQNLVLSEQGVLGLLTTGVVSNADLAANYAGMTFFQNLLEPVPFAGQILEPMIVWENGKLRLHERVRPAGNFLTVFITPHWDEVLNPNIYDFTSRDVLRSEIRKRCPGVREWYVDEHGEPRTAEQFRVIERELRTLYGEDYGHILDDNEISIAELCFEPPATPAERVLDAASRGDVAALRSALAAGWKADGDVSEGGATCPAGTTALHVAAGHGHVEAAMMLLQSGARLDQRTERGVTPLHRAVAHPAVVSRLIAAGAPLDATDRLGQTPLHWAVRSRAAESVALLVGAGAKAEVRDHDGETPLHLAARGGGPECARRLLQAGAAAEARNCYGQTPAHLAVLYGNDAVLDVLLDGRGGFNVADSFGETPLEAAERLGDALMAARLRNAGPPGAKAQMAAADASPASSPSGAQGKAQ